MEKKEWKKGDKVGNKVLGNLCERKHSWQGTNFSLRYKTGECFECHNMTIHKYQNTEEYRIRNNELVKDKYRNNNKYRIEQRILNTMNYLLKHPKAKIYSRYWKTLPYTPKELLDHLSKYFNNIINMENRDKWHIHHIKPRSKFNYNDIYSSEFQECWSLDNLKLEKYNVHDQ